MSEATWACKRASELALHHFPDGTVVFDDANGQLQCLSPAFGQLMELLVASPTGGTAADLAEQLIGEVPASDEVEMVENALSEFSALNFVERTAF